MTAAEPRPRTMDVYRQWWLHDARWYQGVAKRFGQEVANEINAEAIRYVATHVGKQILRPRRELPCPNLTRQRVRCCCAARRRATDYAPACRPPWRAVIMR